MPEKELHLDKAPIAEALIAIDVENLSDDQFSQLGVVGQTLQVDYPDIEPLNQFQIGLDLSFAAGNVSHQGSQVGGPFGFKLASRDKRQLVVFRRNGFSFSRLPPYERWASFSSEARRLWEVFRNVARSVKITGFGLRYINRISIPFKSRIEDYLRLYPQIPDDRNGSPRILLSSYLRADCPIMEPLGHLIIQQATLPQEQPGAATLSLDFDLRFPQPGSDDEEVWDTLEAARRIKNELFVDSLTPSFLETFR
jgi:uncharacterized protein (TIGR04255 family)